MHKDRGLHAPAGVMTVTVVTSGHARTPHSMICHSVSMLAAGCLPFASETSPGAAMQDAGCASPHRCPRPLSLRTRRCGGGGAALGRAPSPLARCIHVAQDGCNRERTCATGGGGFQGCQRRALEVWPFRGPASQRAI